ncbi:MAG TPA: ABC transporter permease [Gemmatimonadales bacterium]|nr:ABC transporter permease [Gemmatimonadales bacterium]
MALSWWSRLSRRLTALRKGERLDHELDAEIRLHLDMEAEELARTRGLDPVEARRQALVAFGGVDRYKEAHRDVRGVRWASDLGQDLHYAARSLRRSPGFSLSAILVLALGIGACTAVFSAVNTVLLDPNYDNLVRVYQQNSPTNLWTLSTVDYRAIETQQKSFSAVGALQSRSVAISTGNEPTRAQSGWVTAGFLRALEIKPVRGRGIEPADEVVGAPPVVVIGYRFAVRTFGDDRAAVGHTITIDGTAFTVIGVLPRSVADLAGRRAEIWPALQLRPPERRGPFGLLVIGRLTPNATVESARQDLAGISERIFPEWASSFQDKTARLTPYPLRTAVLGNSKQMLTIFSAAVGLVLLIAIANVASLMLVRVTGRGQEIALRTILGATRSRLLRLLVTESVTLAAAGALLGILLGALALQALVAFGPALPRLSEARLDGRAVAFAVGLALFAGLIIGAYPTLSLMRGNPAPGLREGERTIGGSRRSQAIRGAFVVAEIALSLPLLAIAGLLLNSFLRLSRVDPGFDPKQILTVRVQLPSSRYANDTTISAYWEHAIPLVKQVAGVEDAGLGSSIPPDDQGWSNNNFDLVDRPVPSGTAQPTSAWPSVTSEYFAALGVPLLEGRLFTPGDTASGDSVSVPPVVVVSRTWARRYFPDGTAVGRRLISGGCTSCQFTTVVGIVGDIKYEGLSGRADAVYSPATEGWGQDMTLFVRTAGSPAEVLDRVRAALRSVDPDVPLDDAAPMEDRVYRSVAQPRNWMVLLSGFATTALLLAGVGIFGMLSYTVRARRREIGVRMALGARQPAVVSMIVRRGMRHALLGTALGLAAAFAGTRALHSTLFDLSTTDPLTLAAVTLLLLGVALIACWLPARRAAAIDPVEAIRLE